MGSHSVHNIIVLFTYVALYRPDDDHTMVETCCLKLNSVYHNPVTRIL
jgi:hypothetical protein